MVLGLNWWELGHLIILTLVIISTTTLEYKKKILVLIISITWFGSTIIQQLVDTSKNKTKCDWKDTFSGNLMFKKTGNKIDDSTITRILFVSIYLFAVLMLMIILLYKIDAQSQILTFLDDKYKYIFVILLPLIVIFINEAPVVFSYMEMMKVILIT